MSISNKISFILGAAETFIYAGGVFGWSFIEYILKKELVYYPTHCGNYTALQTNESSSTIHEALYCAAGQKAFQSAYTWMLIRIVLALRYG